MDTDAHVGYGVSVRDGGSFCKPVYPISILGGTSSFPCGRQDGQIGELPRVAALVAMPAAPMATHLRCVRSL